MLLLKLIYLLQVVHLENDRVQIQIHLVPRYLATGGNSTVYSTDMGHILFSTPCLTLSYVCRAPLLWPTVLKYLSIYFVNYLPVHPF